MLKNPIYLRMRGENEGMYRGEEGKTHLTVACPLDQKIPERVKTSQSRGGELHGA